MPVGGTRDSGVGSLGGFLKRFLSRKWENTQMEKAEGSVERGGTSAYKGLEVGDSRVCSRIWRVRDGGRE